MEEYLKEFLIIGSLVMSGSITIIAIPPILRVARAKHLYEPFETRKVHNGDIPPLGGVAIFLGFLISAIIATDGYTFIPLKYLVASVILVFFIGLKDDLMVISPRKKLLIQVIAALILITMGNVRFTNLHGMMGIHEINYVTSLLLTLFTMLLIVNAFNLIDGIDGLASGLAMLAATVFGIWFYLVENISYAIMSFALVGSLAGFFVYNVFGKKNKLFLGDSGALITGMIISCIVILFNEANLIKTTQYAIGAAPSVSFAIIIIPLIDTLRVISIRLIQKRSPFSPDNNHIHHRLLKLVGSHLGVTLIIVSGNAFIIGTALLFNLISFSVNFQFLFIFLIGVLFSIIPSILLTVKKNRKQTKQKLIYSFRNFL